MSARRLRPVKRSKKCRDARLWLCARHLTVFFFQKNTASPGAAGTDISVFLARSHRENDDHGYDKRRAGTRTNSPANSDLNCKLGGHNAP